MPQVVFYQLVDSDNGVTAKASRLIADAYKLSRLMSCFGNCLQIVSCHTICMGRGHHLAHL